MLKTKPSEPFPCACKIGSKSWMHFLNSMNTTFFTTLVKVSHEVATRLAQEEYERFRIEQDRSYVSDFEKEVKRIVKGKK